MINSIGFLAMLNSKKKKNFETPVSLALTPKGMDIFLKANRGYDIFTTIDRKRNYGLQMSRFEFQTLRSLLEGESICKAEMPFFRFEQTREEIPDVTRLFLNFIFHRRFAEEVLRLMIDSRVFGFWLERHGEGKFTYEIFESPLSDEFLQKYQTGKMNDEEMQAKILDLIRSRVMNETKWSASERNIAMLSAKKFLSTVNNSVWFGMSLLAQVGKATDYFETIADLLWRRLRAVRECGAFADVVGRIAGEQLYLRVRDLLRSAKEPIKVTSVNAEEIESEFRLLETEREAVRELILWSIDETKVGGDSVKRLDVYIVLSGNSNAVISDVQRFSQKEGLATVYDEFLIRHIEKEKEAPVACRGAVFLEKNLKKYGVGFSYAFTQTDKRQGIIQLRIQI